MSASGVLFGSYVNLRPECFIVKFKLPRVQSVDEMPYRSLLGILYRVLHVKSSDNKWILILPFDFNESLVKNENLSKYNYVLVIWKKSVISQLQKPLSLPELLPLVSIY